MEQPTNLEQKLMREINTISKTWLDTLQEHYREHTTRFDQVESRMDSFGTRMSSLEARMTGLESRLTGLETRMSGIESEMRETRADIRSVKATQSDHGELLRQILAQLKKGE